MNLPETGKQINNFSLTWVAAAVIGAALFAFFSTYVAVSYAEFPLIGGDVKNVLQIVQKHDDPTLFSRDFAFSDNGYKLYLPAYIQFVRFVRHFAEGVSYEVSIHYLMFPICFIYVLSMTWLLWRITGRRWLSLLMAFFATLSFETIYGNLAYSIGIYVTPRFLHLAIAPLLFGLLLFYGGNRRWGPLVFLAAGLSSNLHFGSGVSLIFAFILAWILYYGFRKPSREKCFHLGLCAFAGLFGTLPYFIAFQSGQVIGGGVASSVSPDAFNAILHTRFLFYPMDIYGKGQLQWSSWAVFLVKIFFYVFPLFVIANLLLRRIGKERIAYFLLYFTNLAIMVTLAADESWPIILAMAFPTLLLGIFDIFLHRKLDFIRWMLVYLVPGFTFLGAIFSLWTVDLVRALNLYMPSFYYDFGVATKYIPFSLNIYGAMMVAEVISLVFIHTRPKEATVRIQMKLQIFVLFLLAGCFSFRFLQTPYNGYQHYYSNVKKLISGQKIFEPSSIQLDYRQAASWIKTYTPKNALFLVLNKEPRHDFMFRYKTERSMWVCEKDGGMSFYKGRGAFINWYREFEHREKSLIDQNPRAAINYALSRCIDYIFVDNKNFGWLCNTGIGGTERVFKNAGYTLLRVDK